MNATPRSLLTSVLALGLAGALQLPHAMAQDEHQGHHPQAAPDTKTTDKPRGPAMDHGQPMQEMHRQHMKDGGMDHGDMDQKMMQRMQEMHRQHMKDGQMNHGDMDHKQMMEHMRQMKPGAMHPGSKTSIPRHTQTPAGHPVPALTDADRAAAFPELPPQAMHEGGMNYLVLAEQLEWQDADDGNALAWDINGWIGSDIDRLAFRSEGERVDGHTEEAELQLLWSHAIGPWWETVAGVRQDFKPGSPQTWATFGVQGMPLFGLETEATAFLGEGGQSAARLTADYDILLTNQLILQPSLEVNLHGRNDPKRGVGAGLSDTELGLRLRYEINRQFAPYIGVNWYRAYSDTADMRRANNEDSSESRVVAGVRFWF